MRVHGKGTHKVICNICNDPYLVEGDVIKKTKYCSKKCLGVANSRRPAWNKGLKGYHAGANHPKWIADRTLIKQQDRHSNPNYKLWRREVLLRDDFTCRECGFYGWPLQVDHIKPYAFFPELRFELENGRTLCVPCHKNTETYAGKARKTFGIAH